MSHRLLRLEIQFFLARIRSARLPASAEYFISEPLQVPAHYEAVIGSATISHMSNEDGVMASLSRTVQSEICPYGDCNAGQAVTNSLRMLSGVTTYRMAQPGD